VPPAILTYLAEQIGEAPDVLTEYATRDPSRREHLSEIQRIFGFHPFTMQTYRDLSRWLMPIISDQLDPYRTKVIIGTPHEAPT